MCSRSQSCYDSSSGGESDSEYFSRCNKEQSQVQNRAQNQVQDQIPSTAPNQGKHINKGRWTKEEVRLLRSYLCDSFSWHSRDISQYCVDLFLLNFFSQNLIFYKLFLM